MWELGLQPAVLGWGWGGDCFSSAHLLVDLFCNAKRICPIRWKLNPQIGPKSLLCCQDYSSVEQRVGGLDGREPGGGGCTGITAVLKMPE